RCGRGRGVPAPPAPTGPGRRQPGAPESAPGRRAAAPRGGVPGREPAARAARGGAPRRRAGHRGDGGAARHAELAGAPSGRVALGGPARAGAGRAPRARPGAQELTSGGGRLRGGAAPDGASGYAPAALSLLTARERRATRPGALLPCRRPLPTALSRARAARSRVSSAAARSLPTTA